MKLQKPGAYDVTLLTSKTPPSVHSIYGKERIASQSSMKLFFAISSETLMRKLHYFFILKSCVGQGNAASFGEKPLTGYLQSCGRDRGCHNVAATADTLCGWPGWKTNGVHVIFTIVYC